MISVNDVSKAHGARVLFSGVSFRIGQGDRAALVGANGAGKTTLLDLILGEDVPDDGTVTRAGDTTVGVLRQDVGDWAAGLDGRGAVLEAVVAASPVAALDARMAAALGAAEQAGQDGDTDRQAAHLEEYGRLHDRYDQQGGYGLEAQAHRVLAGLGFTPADTRRPVAALSGGWMTRVALARLLVAAPDVLLLDEPTNHLDLDSVTWLQGFLSDYGGAALVVSHDRDFINACATQVIELAGATATVYQGTYDDYLAQRAGRREQIEAAARNQARKVAETEAFIDRFRAKASKASQVQSRIKSLQRMERIEVPQDKVRRMSLRFPEPPRSGRVVVSLEGVAKSYGPVTVYDGLDLVLERGQKVALVGPNGAGKSTLLKLLAGAIEPDAGSRTLGHQVEVAYYAQHQVDALSPELTVLGELTAAVDTARVNPRDVAGAFAFSGDDVDKPVGVLSGGEQSRLALAKLLARPVNLLCMDEPTNHLDIPSRDVLEEALAGYPGTVVLITHDRHLIRSVATTIVAVQAGGVTVYPGGWSYYAAKVGLDGATEPIGARGPDGAAAPDGDVPRTERKRVEAQRRNRVHQATRATKRRLEAVEADLEDAEAEVAALEERLADPGAYDDPANGRALVDAHAAAARRAQNLGAEWEALVEELDAVAASAEQAAG